MRDSYINKIYNTILVLIDKLTKYVIYVIITKNLKIDKLTNLIVRVYIIKRYNM